MANKSKKGKTKDLTPVLKEMIYTAKSFHDSARTLREVAKETQQDHLAVPYAALYAFSVELFLKITHQVSTGKTPEGHILIDLFRTLPHATRTEILAINSALHGEESEIDGFLRPLEKSSDAFIDFRYFYELKDNPGEFYELTFVYNTLTTYLENTIGETYEEVGLNYIKVVAVDSRE